jgi:hypothetical protein
LAGAAVAVLVELEDAVDELSAFAAGADSVLAGSLAAPEDPRLSVR